jgi:hypothetical protein
MKTMHVAASMLALALACGGVAKAETVTATFTQADGGDTIGSYWGDVDVTVTGYGQSSGADFNDAFYIFQNNGENTCKTYPCASASLGFYGLAFGTSPLSPYDSANLASNFLVGPIPAYNPGHVYTVELDTGLSHANAGMLHFGVADGDFGDNSGSFTITVTEASSTPEASTWAMMLLGMAGLGVLNARRMRARAA